MYKNITLFIAAAMVIMCFAFASYLLFTDLIIQQLYGAKRTLFIVILLLYGSYRVYRIYTEIQTIKRERK